MQIPLRPATEHKVVNLQVIVFVELILLLLNLGHYHQNQHPEITQTPKESHSKHRLCRIRCTHGTNFQGFELISSE